jgi:hypothetical protein
MTHDTSTGEQPTLPTTGLAWRGFGGRIPRWVWIVAAVVGVARMTPYALAEWRTAPGWSFTGNLSISPDYMQYRTWSRQTQVEGPIVTDRFTVEPNRPHLPVPLYWGVGQISRLTGVSPEWVYAWLGLPLAALLVLVLYVFARGFLRAPAVPWALGMLLLGGGLGAVLLFIRESWLGGWYPLHVLVVEPLSGPTRAVPFDGFRGNYILHTLLDTHFLAFWITALAAVLALAATVLDYSGRRLAWTVALFLGATALHVYEGITLMAIAIGVTATATARGLAWRHAVTIVLATGVAVALCLAAVWWLHSHSGLPTPDWRGLSVPPLIVLLAFPVSWLLLAIGGVRLWHEGGRREAVLFGWAAGCLALVLSGPFFPYPDRGTMTLQVPMILLAAAIYFRNRTRVRPAHLALLVLLAGPSLALRAWHVARLDFDSGANHIWINPEHTRVISALTAAGPDGVLVADEGSLRWLGPEYAGRHHAGHFFLTVDYERKRSALDAFYVSTDSVAQAAFLHASGATHLFVPNWRDPERFAALSMLRAVAVENVGVLYAIEPTTAPAGAARDQAGTEG